MKVIRVIIIILLLACGFTCFSVLYSNRNLNLYNSKDVISENVSLLDEKIEDKEQTETIDETSENEEKIDVKAEENNNVVNNNKPQTAITYNTKYYIKVNYTQNVVTVYEKDSSGQYTIPVKAMICSTGIDTPHSGIYTIKYRWEWLGLFGNVYGHYVTQIIGDILFHSVPYLKKSPDTLEYWEYDKLGTSASLGCVRLKAIDAKWIYDNISSGTPVEFYSSSNPGPLGKPTAQKISENIECRNWDPTDPNINNPWNTNEEVPDNESSEVPEEPEVNNPEVNDPEIIVPSNPETDNPNESEKETTDVEIYEEQSGQ